MILYILFRKFHLVGNPKKLHKGIYGIQYERDAKEKIFGQVGKCLSPCERHGWDYSGSAESSVVSYGSVKTVETIFDCLQICIRSNNCRFVK